jgi:hypothetical protein
MRSHSGIIWTVVLILGFIWHHAINGPDHDPVTFEP